MAQEPAVPIRLTNLRNTTLGAGLTLPLFPAGGDDPSGVSADDDVVATPKVAAAAAALLANANVGYLCVPALKALGHSFRPSWN